MDLCLKWDVILNGPGDYGPWPNCEESLGKDGWSKKKITDLRRFCQDMNDGDFVVLRLGTSSIYGVGQIVGDYEHCEEFNDVDGWAIGHARRVRWLWKYKERPKKFDTRALKSGDTTQRLKAPAVEAWLESLDISDAERAWTLVNLPKTGVDINIGDISEYLFNKGVASNLISSLADQIDEFIRVAKWYTRSDSLPSEAETVTYLVVPLLLALGWTPQRMAIEWNKIDVALFSSLPRTKESLAVVVEAKKMNDSCLSAFEQARDYALAGKICRRIIVTDGLRYGVFIRNSVDQPFSLYAYMNLTRLRNEYPIYECKGVRDALLVMTPEWSSVEGS